MPRLLVVEDDLTLAEVLRQAFAQRAWEVTLAGSADEALAVFGAAAPDVVLTDKNLPGHAPTGASGTSGSGRGSGVELVRELRARDPAVGIILMTGYGTVESARELLNVGVDEYLEKPFDSLMAVIERVRLLAEKAAARRRATPQAAASPGALTILVAATAARRPHIEQWLDGRRDRIVHVDEPDAIKPYAKTERPELVILDGGSYPVEITCLVAELKARARASSCVVLSEHVMLSDVKRLIELEVKALIDEPITGERGGRKLAAAVERLRRVR